MIQKTDIWKSPEDPSEVAYEGSDKSIHLLNFLENSIYDKIPNKNSNPNEKLYLSERKEKYSRKRVEDFVESARNDLVFDLNDEKSSNNILRK